MIFDNKVKVDLDKLEAQFKIGVNNSKCRFRKDYSDIHMYSSSHGHTVRLYSSGLTGHIERLNFLYKENFKFVIGNTVITKESLSDKVAVGILLGDETILYTNKHWVMKLNKLGSTYIIVMERNTRLKTVDLYKTMSCILCNKYFTLREIRKRIETSPENIYNYRGIECYFTNDDCMGIFIPKWFLDKKTETFHFMYENFKISNLDIEKDSACYNDLDELIEMKEDYHNVVSNGLFEMVLNEYSQNLIVNIHHTVELKHYI